MKRIPILGQELSTVEKRQYKRINYSGGIWYLRKSSSDIGSFHPIKSNLFCPFFNIFSVNPPLNSKYSPRFLIPKLFVHLAVSVFPLWHTPAYFLNLIWQALTIYGNSIEMLMEKMFLEWDEMGWKKYQGKGKERGRRRKLCISHYKTFKFKRLEKKSFLQV